MGASVITGGGEGKCPPPTWRRHWEDKNAGTDPGILQVGVGVGVEGSGSKNQVVGIKTKPEGVVYPLV